jgi:LDH2 family malate/lactate/ureidoglycolate dehydrogenase
VKANTVLVAADVLIEACVQILQKVGVPRGQAEMIAQVVVEGDLRGVESHGVLRLPAYVHRVQAGLMTATTALEVVQKRGATVLLDAQGGFGQVAGIHAMKHAIERARRHGVGLAAVRNANHFGIAAYYTKTALPHKMIGMTATNAAPSMAAWGGTSAYSARTQSAWRFLRVKMWTLFWTWLRPSWQGERSVPPLPEATEFL